MNTQPMEISPQEWQEILKIKVIKEMWGIWIEGPDAITVKEFSEQVYGVKFDFVSGSPGYVGDIYILAGDSLSEPVTLIRDEDGRLKIL